MDKLRGVDREGLKANMPAFAPGDTVRVMVRVREGDKERLQAFEGVCIGRRGGGVNESFTARKISAPAPPSTPTPPPTPSPPGRSRRKATSPTIAPNWSMRSPEKSPTHPAQTS